MYKNIFEEFNLQINAKNVASKISGSKTSAKVYLRHSVNGVISCLFLSQKSVFTITIFHKQVAQHSLILSCLLYWGLLCLSSVDIFINFWVLEKCFPNLTAEVNFSILLYRT